MKKLTILKSIIDLFWIVSLPLIPLIFIFIGFVFMDYSLMGLPIRFNGIDFEVFDNKTKAIMISGLLSYLVLMYCIYLFRKVLRYFQKQKLFDEFVLINLNKIGVLLIASAFLNGVPSFLYKVLYAKKAGIEIGFSPFLTTLCLGLFFMVLSEVFKIVKMAKEENELTI